MFIPKNETPKFMLDFECQHDMHNLDAAQSEHSSGRWMLSIGQPLQNAKHQCSGHLKLPCISITFAYT